ncbi:MAG: N-acetyltransferase [Desulfarculales bacterium]|jgi:amino-acid N-acetyltransferase|nr:N-acetyltransferase [Desulfarculales bacterium]
MLLRKAGQKDVAFIHALLLHYAGEGILLGRARVEIFEFLRDFVIAENENGSPLGMSALHLIWENLCEIRSLAIVPEFRSQGIGSLLVEACISEAITLGFEQIFALTYQTPFFLRHGFKEVSKQRLPNKIWADCVKCVKFPDCDETAVLLEL